MSIASTCPAGAAASVGYKSAWTNHSTLVVRTTNYRTCRLARKPRRKQFFAKDLLDIPVLYLSRYIIRNKALYYRHLLAVTTEKDWETWILFMLEAVRTTAEWTMAKIQAIRELLDETASAIQRKLPKIYSRELVELIFVNPYCRVNDVVKAGIGQRQTAAVYLNTLADETFLEKVKAGRENLYINPPLLALLSDRT